MSKPFFRSNRPEYPHSVSSELENRGITVAVGDCSVTERRQWRLHYQTGKTVHVHAKHYKHNEEGCTALGVCGNGSLLLSHSRNVVTRIGIHTHTPKIWFQISQQFLRKIYLSLKTVTFGKGQRMILTLNTHVGLLDHLVQCIYKL